MQNARGSSSAHHPSCYRPTLLPAGLKCGTPGTSVDLSAPTLVAACAGESCVLALGRGALASGGSERRLGDGLNAGADGESLASGWLMGATVGSENIRAVRAARSVPDSLVKEPVALAAASLRSACEPARWRPNDVASRRE